MKRKLKLMAALAALALIASCVTINVYFPEAEIEDLALKIEEEIARRAAEEAAAEPAVEESEGATEEGGTPPSVSLLDAILGGRPAYAQAVADPGVSNPAIRKIIDARLARVKELGRLKKAGAVGEGNRGLVVVRDLAKIKDLRQRAAAQRLVRAENADREALFREMAKAKKVGQDQLERIRETYAKAIRSKAKPGDWIQLPDGSWNQK